MTEEHGRTDALAPQMPELDTLRAVGALAVMVTHTAFWAGAYTEFGAWGSLLARMDVGVAIFFVLSGFLLSRPWIARAHSGLASPSVRRDFWKRFLRIFPVYIVTVTVALVFIHANDDLGPRHWLTTYSLTDIYVRDVLAAGLTQMWSLATEVAFYLVLPLLMLAAIGRRRHRLPVGRVLVVLVLMVLTSVVWLGYGSEQVPGAENRAVNEWLLSFLGWFAVGIGLALAHVLHSSGTAPRMVARSIDQLASTPGACWAMVLGLLLVAATPLAGPTLLVAPTQSQAVTKNLLYAVAGGLLVFSGAFAVRGSTYSRVMSHPALRHLGHISYGIFCIHLPVLHFVMWITGYRLFDGHLPQIFTLTLVVSLAAAEVLHRTVELPFMRLKNRGPGSATTASAAERATSTRQ
jgi:peptidoglycan/LPS O-acetylase OafA/YrhL